MKTKKTLEAKSGRNKLPDWVYVNLKKYGNCAISPKRLNAIGEVAMIKELTRNGYACTIKRKEHPYESRAEGNKPITKDEVYVIIEVKGVLA